MVITWSRRKLNKYLSRIDGAILLGRYALALKLANRLLKHYYRSFIVSKIPTEQEKENIRLMAHSIRRYIIHHYRQCSMPDTEKRLLMMGMITNVMDVHSRFCEDVSEDTVADEATATYVRRNVTEVIRFLMKYA
ncbi:MAG: hypothetical protein D6714_10050 [Bacteroidetes bacterium]|nr:MAG: hypothetical protein D6714_10050 [Bacteroidota bacterium]